MPNLKIKTSKAKEIVDITDKINDLLKRASTKEGICHLHVMHTTCALTTADLDPGTDLDMLDAFEQMVPKLNYRHPHDPNHVGDHIVSSLIGSSVSIPFENVELILGTWQRVVLVELSGPRDREIVVNLIISE